MKKKNLKVAVTGGIASGKSTFCSFLAADKYEVINADEVSKEILSGDPGVKQMVIKSFGKQAYNSNEVNKEYLAETVFSNKDKLQILNSILHPAVTKSLISTMETLIKSNKLIFVEAALIYEAKLEKYFDYVVVITADEEIRKHRAIKSKSISADQFERRLKMQMDEDKKIKKADFVFYNNGSVSDLKQKAKLLLLTLNAMVAE